MRLYDALFNWLQIHLVAEARPDDHAARETVRFFEEILREDHHVSEFRVDEEDETMIHVRYTVDGKTKRQMFDKESAAQMLTDLNADIRYH